MELISNFKINHPIGEVEKRLTVIVPSYPLQHQKTIAIHFPTPPQYLLCHQVSPSQRQRLLPTADNISRSMYASEKDIKGRHSYRQRTSNLSSIFFFLSFLSSSSIRMIAKLRSCAPFRNSNLEWEFKQIAWWVFEKWLEKKELAGKRFLESCCRGKRRQRSRGCRYLVCNIKPSLSSPRV